MVVTATVVLGAIVATAIVDRAKTADRAVIAAIVDPGVSARAASGRSANRITFLRS
jgi:ACT domain-containing protein